MSLEGTVQNGVIILDNGHHLPDGTRVEVVVKPFSPAEDAGRPTLAWLLEYAGTVPDLPEDMALNHDHYLHGAPKK